MSSMHFLFCSSWGAPAIAVSSIVSELAIGKTLEEVKKINPESVVDELG